MSTTNRPLTRRPKSFYLPRYNQEMGADKLIVILDQYQRVFDWCDDYSFEFLVAVEACRKIRRIINIKQGKSHAMA